MEKPSAFAAKGEGGQLFIACGKELYLWEEGVVTPVFTFDSPVTAMLAVDGHLWFAGKTKVERVC